MVPPMAPSGVVGGLTNSSLSSGIFFQGEGQSQNVANSQLSSSFRNSGNSIAGTSCSSLAPVSGDMSNAVLNSVPSSGPSVGASSLVTDANSALSGGPHLQRSASINTDSYLRLPASPISFSSNNISISGSSVMDGSSVMQQNSRQDQCSQKAHQSQQQQRASSATSLPTSQMGHVSLSTGPRNPSSFSQESNHLSHVQKKPRLDIKQEDIVPQQIIQQLLQRQGPDSVQLQAFIQQQRLQQHQQQILQSLPPLQRVQLQQHQQHQQRMQLRQQFQQQGLQPVSGIKRSFDTGVCARRLMQYLYHQRQRPSDNAIAYWRKFVAEYYSPHAKKRWCLSLYDNVGQNALGVFPQATVDSWQCNICNSKSGRGFEATFEVLPRLNEIKFSSGVIDELLFLDLPREFRYPSGVMTLEYAKAVQESVYDQLRVIREGQLRITFTPDLKILYWEFCARRHEELLPRRLVAPQVSQLVLAAQKCQNTISESGSDGVSQQELQSNSNMVLAAGHQLAKSLELQSLNDLGFSKRYVRCLQISEVVNSMKDLIDICKEHKVGPIDGLKNFPRHTNVAKIQMQKMQEMEHLANIQGLQSDQNTLNKLILLHPGLSGHMVNNHHLVNHGSLGGFAQSSMAPNNQNLLMRQNSMNSNSYSLQPEALSSYSNTNQSPSSSYQGQSALLQGSGPNYQGSSFSSPLLQSQQQQPQLQQQQQHRFLNANGSHPQNPQGSQALQQHMIQQLLQEMNSNTGSYSGQTPNGGFVRANGMAFGSSVLGASASSPNMHGSSGNPAPSRSNSFKAASNSDSSPAGCTNNGFCQKSEDLPQNLQMSDELAQDIAQELTDNGFFGSDINDYWKG